MTSRTSTARNSGRVVATLGIIGALVATSGGPLIAESNDSNARSGLVGTWAVQVTGRDCATNTPLGPPFNALITFHQGGTLSESPGSLAFAPNQRSAGHGVWTHEGRHTLFFKADGTSYRTGCSTAVTQRFE